MKNKIKVGDFYEDCAYHPCLCISISICKDELNGISLINGNVRNCSPRHCGPVKLTNKQAIKLYYNTAARGVVQNFQIK